MRSFLFRDALASDEDAILELASHLDTLNLPPDRGFIRDLLARSCESFRGGANPELFDPERRFLFVLQAPDGRVVGTSMIHAQHGTHAEPHVFFRVIDEERYAEVVLADERRQVHMVHPMLHLGLTYQGPTEIGGLVLDPSMRRHPEKLGRLLSLGRFSFIAAFRAWFRDRVLAELLPPLERGPEGRTDSRLWDALGSRFTNLTYAEADRLSAVDKEFIWRLFPMSPVHLSLLPPEVQDIVGRVGPETTGAMRLLQSIGFAYSRKVDPFDGGPHWEAVTNEISLVRGAQWCRGRGVAPDQLGDDAVPGIVARVRQDHEPEDAPRFRAVWTMIVDEPPLELDDATVGLDERAQVWTPEPVGDWAVSSPGEGVHSKPPRRATIPQAAFDALTLPEGDEQVLVALRPQQRRTSDTPPG